MERAGSALGPLIKDLGLEDALKLYRIKNSWKDFIGEPLAMHASPTSLKGGLLFVNVDSPAWLQQAGYFKSKMIEKLAGFGIDEMKFKLGRLEPPTRKKTSELPPFTEPDPALIEELISAIEDEEVREAARRAARKALGTKLPDKG